MSHTPGPWTTLSQPGRTVCAGSGKDFAIVCNMADFDPVSIEYDNARLISAAPELLEALTLLHDNLAEYQRINKIGGYDNHDMKLARAAIAKALGK